MKYNNSIAAVAASVCLFFACNSSKDYKNDDDTATYDKQTAIAQQSNVDTAAMNNGGSTAPAPGTDTATTSSTPATSSPAVTSTTTGAAKPNPAKKGHKGQVRMAKYSPRMTEKMEEDKNGVYNYAEVLPMFPGGQKELEKFVQDHIQYPQEAVDNGVEGTVNLTFAVDETGKVYSPQVQGETVGYGLDDEAKRVVNAMPKWTPGRIKGKNVKTYYTLPITFTLL